MARFIPKTRRRQKRGCIARASVRPQFDLVLKGGRVLSPNEGIDAESDIGIRNGKIAAISADIPCTQGAISRDLVGLLVLPGLIDTHAHIFEYVSGDFGLSPDAVGVRSGATSVVDQGGPSALTIDGFRSSS